MPVLPAPRPGCPSPLRGKLWRRSPWAASNLDMACQKPKAGPSPYDQIALGCECLVLNSVTQMQTGRKPPISASSPHPRGSLETASSQGLVSRRVRVAARCGTDGGCGRGASDAGPGVAWEMYPAWPSQLGEVAFSGRAASDPSRTCKISETDVSAADKLPSGLQVGGGKPSEN